MVLAHGLHRDSAIVIFPLEQQTVIATLVVEDVLDAGVTGGRSLFFVNCPVAAFGHTQLSFGGPPP